MEEFLKEFKIEYIFKAEEDPKDRKKTVINRRKESFLEKMIHPVFWEETKAIRDDNAIVKEGNAKNGNGRNDHGSVINQALRTK